MPTGETLNPKRPLTTGVFLVLYIGWNLNLKMSDYKKTALVLGAGGFIGSHMVKRLRSEGYWVRGVDLKYPEYGDTDPMNSSLEIFVLLDL